MKYELVLTGKFKKSLKLAKKVTSSDFLFDNYPSVDYNYN